MSMNNIKTRKLKILVALSGGVDSSLVAQLLVNKGYDVSAVFLKFWQDKKNGVASENSASSSQAFSDAQKVAQKIGANFFSLDLSQEFKKEVVDYFLSEYEKGRTPNPCIVCNRDIKIGLLLKKALALGYDGLATGHYLKIVNKKEGVTVYRAKDRHKDQSYFLYTLNQTQLKKLYFPLAKYTKDEVRELAHQYGLPTASKKESQDICFISGSHNNFLKNYIKLKEGNIRLKESGEIIGRHQGLALYTLGQRKGIEIGGSGPYYVAEKEQGNNTLWVTSSWSGKELLGHEFIVSQLNFINPKKITFPLNCQVMIRYGQEPLACRLELYQKDKVRVILKTAVRAINAGQSAVFYQASKVLGGGVII